jgi:hypothetical protein
MHHLLLLDGAPSFFLCPPTFITLYMCVLCGEGLLELLLVGFIILHLLLNVLLISDDIQELFLLGQQGLLFLLQLQQLSLIVITPAFLDYYLTILLLSILISRWLSWISRSSW